MKNIDQYLSLSVILIVHCITTVYCNQTPSDNADRVPLEAHGKKNISGLTSLVDHMPTSTVPLINVRNSIILTSAAVQPCNTPTQAPASYHPHQDSTHTDSPGQERVSALTSSATVVQSITSDMGGGHYNSSSPTHTQSKNTATVLATLGAIFLVVAVVTLSLGALCLYRSRCKRDSYAPSGVKLRRTHTTRSTNSLEFVFNPPYQWTCRQVRLLSHLKPDTTGYQSHWSLTRDVKKPRGMLNSDPKWPHTEAEKSDHPPPSKDAVVAEKEESIKVPGSTQKEFDRRGKGEYSASSQKGSMKIYGENFVVNKGACVIGEDQSTHNESSDSIDNTEEKARACTDCSLSCKAATFPEKSSQDSSEKESFEDGFPSLSAGCPKMEAVSMFHNPLYGIKSDKDSSEGGEEREEEREGEMKEEQVDDGFSLEVSSSTYSGQSKSLGLFLASDSEAYDSGIASAVSTDVASLQQSTTDSRKASNDRNHRHTSTGRDGGRGMVESYSFEFSTKSGPEDTIT